jgi:hypothetical protein
MTSPVMSLDELLVRAEPLPMRFETKSHKEL